MKQTLWTPGYTRLIVATVLGSAGGIAGSFALSYLVFDETGSTLAFALSFAMQMIPGFLLPLVAAPWMDRLPRKPFLVWGDAINGIAYALAGLYLLKYSFSYIGYLLFSLLLACLNTFDSLAYDCIYPQLIPQGLEEKGYAISSTLYPVLRVVLLPVAAVLLGLVGVGWILIAQGVLALLAAIIENGIQLQEAPRAAGEAYTLRLWWQDIQEAARYLKRERGLRGIYGYMATVNGVASGYSSILFAFFSTTPGFSLAMYAMFSGMEFLGRSLGGTFHYNVSIPKKKRFGFTLLVYLLYETMDACLLWLPYPLMLANRGLCGFLGTNSATLRQAAVQRYIPEHLRARLNAFEDMLILLSGTLLSLVIGALGEVLDLRVCMSLCGGIGLIAIWLAIWRSRKHVRAVYEYEEA